jgi:hypothetical protein
LLNLALNTYISSIQIKHTLMHRRLNVYLLRCILNKDMTPSGYILCRFFGGIIAHKTLNYLAFQSFNFDCT